MSAMCARNSDLSAESLTMVEHSGYVLRPGAYIFAISSRGEERPAQITGLYSTPSRTFYATIRWLRYGIAEDGSTVGIVIIIKSVVVLTPFFYSLFKLFK